MPWACANCESNNDDIDTKCVTCGINKSVRKDLPPPPRPVSPPPPRPVSPPPVSTESTDSWQKFRVYGIVALIVSLLVVNQIRTFQSQYATSSGTIESSGVDNSVPPGINYPDFSVDDVTVDNLNPEIYPEIKFAAYNDNNSTCFRVELLDGDFLDDQQWHLGDSRLDPNGSTYRKYSTFSKDTGNTLVTVLCPESAGLEYDTFNSGFYRFDVIDSSFRGVVSIRVPHIGGLKIKITLLERIGQSTLSNQSLTQTEVAKQISSTKTTAKEPTRVVAYLAIALDPGNGRDDVNCVSMNITGGSTRNWRMKIRGASFEPAVFDDAGNARICNEWIGQQSGFYIDILNANLKPVPRGSAPGVGGDIFKSRWITP
jgi:hypothetical protein